MKSNSKNPLGRQVTTLFLTYALAVPPQLSLAAGTAPGMSPGSFLHSILNSVISAVQPTPADPKSFDSQLKRFEGQTEFLTALPYYRNPRDEEKELARAASPSEDKAGGGRAIQESDVYKVGKAGSKNLFLLNDYRGLQVVNFNDGADKAKLIARVPATGNYPENMYYDEASERLIALERNYFNDSDEYSESQSRIVIYSIKDPAKPVIESVLDLRGEIADSRMVGNIIYLGTRVQPNYRSYYSDDSKERGLVYSIKVGDKVEVVQKLELSINISHKENMNIVKDGDRYYLIASLDQRSWGLEGRASMVQVVDITDPDGAIKNIMTVSVKGSLNERSQTTIKNGVLMTTTNYITKRPVAADQRLRIAVETFQFPPEANTPAFEQALISESEYNYRKLHIERELSKIADSDLKDAETKRLTEDPALGLKGVYVNAPTGLQKAIPDHSINAGDTTNLNARLRDVRYVDDLVYVFWVPATMIDPLDLFDISDYTNIKHLARLPFDGWIDRSYPINYKGNKLIVGLGWERPAINNEDNRSYPIAKIFQINELAEKKYEAVPIAGLTLDMKNFYTDFNSLDKFVEFNIGEDGKGNILFAGRGNVKDNDQKHKWMAGGKLIGLDLEAAVTKTGVALQEGSFLKGPTSWLKRVFSNPEIMKINAFSNMGLSTYDVQGAGDVTQVANAIQTLELARGIRDYEVLTHGTESYGVQVISNYSSEKNETEFRVVPVDRGDAELPEVLSKFSLSGSLQSLVKTETGDGFIAITSVQSPNPLLSESYSYINDVAYTVSSINLIGNQLSVVDSKKWEVKAVEKPTDQIDYASYSDKLFRSLVKVNADTYLVTSNLGAKELKIQPTALLLTDLTVKNCEVDKRVNQGLRMVGNQLVHNSYEDVLVSPKPNATGFTKNYVAKAAIVGSEIVCEPSVNIPGSPVMFSANGYLVTDDRQFLGELYYGDEEKKEEEQKPEENPDSVSSPAGRMADYYDRYWDDGKGPKTNRSLTTVKFEPTQATLTDHFDLEDKAIQSEIQSLPGDKLAVTSRSEETSFWGRPMYFEGYYPGGNNSDSYSILSILSLNAAGDLLENKIPLNGLEMKGSVSVSQIYTDSKEPNKHTALISGSQKYSVISFDDTQSYFTAKKLLEVNPDFSVSQEAVKIIKTPGHWGNYYGGSSAVYEPASKRFTIPMNESGVKQFIIQD